jgi:hypothetical protein
VSEIWREKEGVPVGRGDVCVRLQQQAADLKAALTSRNMKRGVLAERNKPIN